MSIDVTSQDNDMFEEAQGGAEFAAAAPAEGVAAAAGEPAAADASPAEPSEPAKTAAPAGEPAAEPDPGVAIPVSLPKVVSRAAASVTAAAKSVAAPVASAASKVAAPVASAAKSVAAPVASAASKVAEATVDGVVKLAAKAKRPGADSEGQEHVFDAPAWEGHEAAPVNLVLEGGAMRGMFTAGVLDFFLDQGLFCQRVIGVSAGALVGYSYVTGAAGYSARMNMEFCDDWRYLSLRSYAVTGNVYGREFAFDTVPNKLDPVDYAAFNASPMKLVTVASNLDTGEADYHEFTDAQGDIPYLVASSSMPAVSQIVEVDGKRLLDGGTCDSVPIVYSMLTGAKKHIVVLTRDATYRKEPIKLMSIMRQAYADYPYYLERIEHRHYEYNRVYRALARMHEAGEVFVIQPQKPVTVKNLENDEDKLFDLYQQGLAEAARQWPALQAYLEA